MKGESIDLTLLNLLTNELEKANSIITGNVKRYELHTENDFLSKNSFWKTNFVFIFIYLFQATEAHK